MTLFDAFKTAIFPNINDAPREATADKGSNASDLIAKFNGLIDKLNEFISPTWGDRLIYIDGTSGNDSNDGLTPSTAKKTQTSIIELIKTKAINKRLKLLVKDVNFSSINFDGIIALEGGKLVIEKNSGYFVIESGNENNARFIVNTPAFLEVTIKDAVFHCYETQIFDTLKKLQVVDCSFQVYFGYTGTILEFDGIKESIVSGNTILGGDVDYYGSNIVKIKNCEYLISEGNQFRYTTGDTISIADSNVYFKKGNYVDESYLDNALRTITISQSNVKFGVNSGFNGNNIAFDSSSVVENVQSSDVRQSKYFFFPTLSNTTVTLIPNPTRTARIKGLFVVDDTPSASYKLKISGNDLSAIYEEPKEKTYDTYEYENNLDDANESQLELEITGTANNITVQVDLIEF